MSTRWLFPRYTGCAGCERGKMTQSALKSHEILQILVIAFGLPVVALGGVPCPTTPIPNVASPLPPNDVCIPDGFEDLPIDYFDDYSWRAFVSMVWPAANGQRGTPDATKSIN